ncbi:MAG: hypothetical protein ACLFV7_01585 [Phycisphaerae bacterium]
MNAQPPHIPPTFQQLTDEDRAIYGTPEVIELCPPLTDDPAAARKRAHWLEWRAAPYPARRHSEYLYLPADGNDGPRILLSAVLKTPASLEEYVSAAPKKRRYDLRGNKARNKGYQVRPIRPAEKAEGIWQVIHSSDTRQGRPISPMFDDRPRDYDFPEYVDFEDPQYRDICTGVFTYHGDLAAYLLGKRAGEHVYYDEIMGHDDFRDDDVTYLLHAGFIEQAAALDRPPRYLHYGPWYSGADPYSPTGGLNRWKRKTNFKPAWLTLACC